MKRGPRRVSSDFAFLIFPERATQFALRMSGTGHRQRIGSHVDAARALVAAELIEACTDLETFERPPQADIKYFAWCDSAGGLGSDSMTLALAHRQTDGERIVVLDLVRERKQRSVRMQSLLNLHKC